MSFKKKVRKTLSIKKKKTSFKGKKQKNAIEHEKIHLSFLFFPTSTKRREANLFIVNFRSILYAMQTISGPSSRIRWQYNVFRMIRISLTASALIGAFEVKLNALLDNYGRPIDPRTDQAIGKYHFQ